MAAPMMRHPAQEPEEEGRVFTVADSAAWEKVVALMERPERDVPGLLDLMKLTPPLD